jgi:hypothetical protein
MLLRRVLHDSIDCISPKSGVGVDVRLFSTLWLTYHPWPFFSHPLHKQICKPVANLTLLELFSVSRFWNGIAPRTDIPECRADVAE